MTTPYIKYISFKDMIAKLGGRSRSSLYRDIEAGRLPKPLKFGGRVFWIETEVDEFLNTLRANGDL